MRTPRTAHHTTPHTSVLWKWHEAVSKEAECCPRGRVGQARGRGRRPAHWARPQPARDADAAHRGVAAADRPDDDQWHCEVHWARQRPQVGRRHVRPVQPREPSADEGSDDARRGRGLDVMRGEHPNVGDRRGRGPRPPDKVPQVHTPRVPPPEPQHLPQVGVDAAVGVPAKCGAAHLREPHQPVLLLAYDDSNVENALCSTAPTPRDMRGTPPTPSPLRAQPTHHPRPQSRRPSPSLPQTRRRAPRRSPRNSASATSQGAPRAQRPAWRPSPLGAPRRSARTRRPLRPRRARSAAAP